MDKTKYDVNIEEKYTAFQTTIGNIDIADKDAQLKIKSLAEDVSEDIDRIDNELIRLDGEIDNATVGFVTEDTLNSKISDAVSDIVEGKIQEHAETANGIYATKAELEAELENSKTESDSKYQPIGEYATNSSVEEKISSILALPTPPNENGKYTLTCTVTDDGVTYSWVSAGE